MVRMQAVLWKFVVVAVVVSLFGLAAPAPAAFITTDITTADGDGADTHIDGGEKGTAHGDSTRLALKTASTAFTRLPYFRFDLSELSGAEITDATFVAQIINVFAGPGTVEFAGLNDDQNADDWNETDPNGLTWNDQLGVTSGQFDSETTTFLGSVSNVGDGGAGSFFTFSDSRLIDFLNADTDGLVTIIARDDDSESLNMPLYSKENSEGSPPKLELTYVPEPASMALLGLGGLAMIGRRRKT